MEMDSAMQLPDFLARDDAGFIYLTGHRIGLHHVFRLYCAGASPEMIAAHYPTLGLSLIHRVIAFYLDNMGEIDQYVAGHEREIQQQIASTPAGPSIATLRQRLEQLRGTSVGTR